jgi:integral membrane protein
MHVVRFLRWAGITEGISYLLLLFVAMPMKYALDMPLAVRIVGSVHGFLFLLFLGALIGATLSRRWSMSWAIQLFMASLVPFGFLLVDRRLREEIAMPKQTA